MRGSKRKKQLSPLWLGVPWQEIGIIKTFRSLEEVPGGAGTPVSWEEVEEQPVGVLSSKAACPGAETRTLRGQDSLCSVSGLVVSNAAKFGKWENCSVDLEAALGNSCWC